MGFLWAVQERPHDYVSETYFTVSGVNHKGKVTGSEIVKDRSYGMGCIEWKDVPSRKVFEGAVILALHQVVDHCYFPYEYNMPPFTTRDLVAFGPTEIGVRYLRDIRLVETVMHGLVRRIVKVVPIDSGFIRYQGELAKLGIGTQGHVALWANDFATGKSENLLRVS